MTLSITIAHDILNDMSREFGFRELPHEQLDEARGMSTREFIRHLGISKWRVPLVARRGLQLLHERIHLVEPIPGMPETLATLRDRGERMAILTSNSQANVEAFLARHDLPYFDESVHFPDARLEYEDADRWVRHEDIEVVTEHYRGGHAASTARSGFTSYRIGLGVRASGGRGGGSSRHPRWAQEFLG